MFRRLSACVLLFGFAALAVVAPQPAPVHGQKVNAAEKQILALKAEVAELKAANTAFQSANATLQATNTTLQSTNATLQATAKKATSNDKADDKTIKSLQGTVDGYKKAGLVHFVVLKLKSDSPSTEAQDVIDATYKDLAKIKTVRGVWAGRPSENGSPDFLFTDYTVALALVFDDAAGLKKYLDDAVYTKFVEKHIKLWEAPVVYDFEPKK